jgi:RND family efflux transporter MFP subunit
MDQDRHDERPQPADQEHGHAPSHPPVSARKALIGIIVLVVIAIIVAIAGIVPRVRARARLQQQTGALAAPDVLVLTPQLGKPSAELVLPGSIQAYTDSPIYARTDGYLKKWYFDIGAHVRKGQLLAVISSPEVDQELLQARADLATAQANASLAKTNATRYQSLLTQNAVSKQDTDTFVSQQASTSSAVRSAQANVQRLEELQSFENIYAPFDGVITARNVDIGQLINAGAGQQAGQQMFRMASIRVLRVYVNVPQVYSRGAVPGVKADVTLSQFPGQKFTGTLVRTANAIDPTSRTLLVEFDIDNRDGKLMPGAYAEVHMNINQGVPSLLVPVSALIFRSQGLQLGTVVKAPKGGDVAKLVNVTLGNDDGRTVEVISGLEPGSRVIQSPPDSLIDGEAVNVVQPRNTQQEEAEPSGGGSPE